MSLAINLAERRLLPDALIRIGIRKLLKERLATCSNKPLTEWAKELTQSPIAIEQDAANTQHYEVPAVFYQRVLGPNLKYSSAYYEEGDDLGAAEDRMLSLSCERAQLENGHDILEIGCGWGSLTLFMAARYPESTITALSNSASQREYIMGQAADRGLNNIEVITADLASFEQSQQFDRIVSVECLEHMRNYEKLFAKFSGWLKDDGLTFIHVFCHKEFGYPFSDDNDNDWMSRHFFTGGQMPGFHLFEHFNQDLCMKDSWQVSGTHYAKTSRHWLDNIDAVRDDAELFPNLDDPAERKLMRQRWRMFFMACEELFGYNNGSEWIVGHYLLRKAAQTRLAA